MGVASTPIAPRSGSAFTLPSLTAGQGSTLQMLEDPRREGRAASSTQLANEVDVWSSRTPIEDLARNRRDNEPGDDVIDKDKEVVGVNYLVREIVAVSGRKVPNIAGSSQMRV
ncbi:MAG TPA: hypothetical protein P5181_06505 [Dermatophilaceae bacterium]|nr:hypothetical protein [Dermatophilaceae bacterium]